MNSALPEFLRASGARRFAWGVCDCCLWAADWVATVTGRDPAASLRGTYRTRRAAAAIVAAHGGMIAFVEAHMAPLGAARTDDPLPGDLAVVDTAGGAALGIVTPLGVAVKRQRLRLGVSVAARPVLAAWRVAA